MMLRQSFFPLVAYALLAALIGVARGGDLYLGQKIVPKNGHLDARVGLARVGTEMNFDWPAKVEHVNGQWLWITDDGSYNVEWHANQEWVSRPIQGWVSKNDVILLEGDPIAKKSAHDYLTECLRRDPKAGWAYWLRGVILARDKRDWPAAISDLTMAIRFAPQLDDAHETLGWCEYQQTLVEHAAIFAKLRNHEIKMLRWPNRLTVSIRWAMEWIFPPVRHFKYATCTRGQTPSSMVYAALLKPIKDFLYPDDEVPDSIKRAVRHFKAAASILPRPHTFVDWADALAVGDWNQFHRRIFIFYLEKPETFEDQMQCRRDLDPFSEAGSKSALCLYTRALEIFPSYDSAKYGRGGMFEYVADDHVYKMVQSSEWKTLTKADAIDKVRNQLRAAQADLDKLTEALKPVVEELNRMLAMPSATALWWRIYQLDRSREEYQAKIDKAHTKIEQLNDQFKKYSEDVSKNQTEIDRLQSKTVKRIKNLVDLSLKDYAETIVVNPTSYPAYRDRAAVLLMLLDPTGLRPIQQPSDFGRAELALSADRWAKTAAKLADYDDMRTLAILAATSNAVGSYDEAIRREKMAWEQMDKQEKEFARNYFELYKQNKDDSKASGQLK